MSNTIPRCARLADGLFWHCALRDFKGWGPVYVDATGPVQPHIAYPNLFQLLGFAAARGITVSA